MASVAVESIKNESIREVPISPAQVSTEAGTLELAWLDISSQPLILDTETEWLDDINDPCDQPSSVVTEDTIKENMVKHKEAIIGCLNPAQLFSLYTKFDLDEVSINQSKKRIDKATILYEEVLKRGACCEFLSSLEEDTEHMGHRYIVSLLRGTQFAEEEEIRESEKLRKQILSKAKQLITLMNVTGLTSQLIEEELVTRDEIEELNSPQNTKQNQVRFLLGLLKTKGPTAFTAFFNCLLADNTLAELLPDRRKRRLSDVASTGVTKRTPFLLEAPKGLSTQRYLQAILSIRKGHQIGGDRWKTADDLCDFVISSDAAPIEMKVAVLLEGTITFILKNGPEEKIVGRVEQARKMCLELSRNQRNAQNLEGRCEFILAKYYKRIGDYEKAQRHLDTFFRLIANCEPGEDIIQANYTQGLMLIDGNASDQEREKGIGYLRYAITAASGQDYGYKTLQYGSIRLAQAQIGSSSLNLGKSREELSTKKIEDAKNALKAIDLEKHELPLRTKCMYLCTLSDVYRIDGQLEEAVKYAKKAMKIVEAHNLTGELTATKIRLQVLEKKEISREH